MVFTACSKIQDTAMNDLASAEKSSQRNSVICTDCNFSADLTDAQIDGLMHMREEEKVARDVYLTFYDMYKKPIFSNIAKSEQKHMDAILYLINGYGLNDPAEGNDIGIFTEEFQELYNDLIEKGASLTAAYEVGVEIETLDIVDLEYNMTLTPQVPTLQQVYNNLLKASQNHLEAFSSKL